MKPFRGIIENWVKVKWGDKDYYIVGHIVPEDDEDRLQQGFRPGVTTEIRTSLIENENGDMVETMNSRYKLGEAR